MRKRKARRNRNRKGSFTLTAAVIMLTFLLMSRKSSGSGQGGRTTNSKSESMRATIKNLLTQAGYSARQAYNWFLIANMETAGFTSNLFVTANNAFGMKQPKVRNTTSIGPTPSGFASYSTLDNSVNDLVLYLNYFKYPADFATLDEQLLFMKQKGYFANESLDSYRGKVVAWANKFGYPLMQLAA